MSALKITLAQYDIHWETREQNFDKLEKLLDSLEVGDLVILPEMFQTGFSMNTSRISEEPQGYTFKWMQNIASKHQTTIVGSFVVRQDETCFNRLYWVYPDGTFGTYDKANHFRMMNEHLHFKAGTDKNYFAIKGWKVLPLICYDLRFPEWSRNTFAKSNEHFGYDLLIYVGNWPAPRIEAWDTLLKARAMENSAYVAAVNRIGTDANGVSFNGHSALIGPKGNHISTITETESISTHQINREDLTKYRNKFPVHLDWRSS